MKTKHDIEKRLAQIIEENAALNLKIETMLISDVLNGKAQPLSNKIWDNEVEAKVLNWVMNEHVKRSGYKLN
ncbi:MAG: hypothetical protein AABY22_16525 [Nanoarchaeota archaeon]